MGPRVLVLPLFTLYPLIYAIFSVHDVSQGNGTIHMLTTFVVHIQAVMGYTSPDWYTLELMGASIFQPVWFGIGSSNLTGHP